MSQTAIIHLQDDYRHALARHQAYPVYWETLLEFLCWMITLDQVKSCVDASRLDYLSHNAQRLVSALPCQLMRPETTGFGMTNRGLVYFQAQPGRSWKVFDLLVSPASGITWDDVEPLGATQGRRTTGVNQPVAHLVAVGEEEWGSGKLLLLHHFRPAGPILIPA